MDVWKSAADLIELEDGFVGIGRDTEHLSEDGDAYLEADAGEKSDKHGLGEEVGDEAELEQAREQ